MTFPATQIVHMPSGAVPACDTHAAQLRGLARVLGYHAATKTAIPSWAPAQPEACQCSNQKT